MLVNYDTQFSIYNEDDYKKCVCSSYPKSSQGLDADCPQKPEAERCNWINQSSIPFEKTTSVGIFTET